jgi:flagellin
MNNRDKYGTLKLKHYCMWVFFGSALPLVNAKRFTEAFPSPRTNSVASINTNMPAQIASNSMTRNERLTTSTMERLSTGLRINSAKDDAAGLTISANMTSQVLGLNQAVRNANDAISMIQVAEGALKEVTNMFQRMRELAVQSISDSNTAGDRAALNSEYKQLAAQTQRMVENTQWNGTHILDGTRRANTFQVGASANQTIDVDFGDGGGVFTLLNGGGRGKPISLNTSTNRDTGATEITFSQLPDLNNLLLFGAKVDDHVYAMAVYMTTAVDSAGVPTLTRVFESGGNMVVGDTQNFNNITSADGTAFSFPSGFVGNRLSIPSSNISVSDIVPLGSGLWNTDVTSSAFASYALETLDLAIKGGNDVRANLGGSMSRLEFASDNLQNVAQNSSAARSRVLDADYASETTELARTQIIQQASTAMLSQANQAQQSALSLLK